MTSDKPHYFKHIFFLGSPRRIVDATLEFFRLEAAGGIVLVLASMLAMILANSPYRDLYEYAFNGIDFRIGFSDVGGLDFELKKSLIHWINDGLMAIFFLLVGLEIKHELVAGELANKSKAVLPLLAAIGGTIVPAAIYLGINMDDPKTIPGWAIPCATDIAFALGILSLLGNRIPLSIKVLLTAVAILDDLGAILIIALFYSSGLETWALMFAVLPIAGLFLLNYFNVARRAPYMILGFILWVAVLKSGVHATMAGVITAFFIPLSIPDPEERRHPARRLQNDLHPWIAFLVLPLFGFANAGVPLQGMGLSSQADPLTLGIALGLFIGKQLGVFGAIFLAVKLGLSPKPEGASWRQLYGLSILCGIGFTMSLFIGGLAFSTMEMQAQIRLGVLGGSIVSAVIGYMLLACCGKKQQKPA